MIYRLRAGGAVGQTSNIQHETNFTTVAEYMRTTRQSSGSRLFCLTAQDTGFPEDRKSSPLDRKSSEELTNINAEVSHMNRDTVEMNLM